MNFTVLSGGGLLSLSGFLPLIVLCAAVIVIFLVFKLIGKAGKLLWKLLLNSLAGAVLLCIFDVVFYNILHIDFFYIPITWLNSLVTGVLGVPGVILLLIIKAVI